MISYAISDPTTLHFDQRLTEDLDSLLSRAEWFLYRDKKTPLYRSNAEQLSAILRKRESPKPKFFIHDDDLLARELEADGVHFSGAGIVNLERAKKSGLYIVASVHSLEEARELEVRGVHAVTLSPIYASPGKGSPLGIEYLRRAVRVLKIPVIALGGIVNGERIEAVRRAGASGFASIRYFAGGHDD